MTASHSSPNNAPQSLPNSDTDWKTWSPFQSQAVRDICANMTPEEKSTVTRRGLMYGLWVAVSVALPIHFIFMGLCAGNLNPIIATIGGLLVLAHIIGIPIWQGRQRQFLCNTIWARENGIEPASLQMFRFRKRK